MSLFIGTQYFRPPHPHRSEWERDIQNIVDTGLTMIRIWVYWSQVNPRPDQWVWEDVDAFFEAAQRHNLQVLVQLMPDAMPYWFKDQHPEALFRDRDGKIIYPAAGGAMGVGGFPGPNYDHPVAIQFGGEFITRTIQRYAGHPALYAWDIWNELWPFVISPWAVYHNDATVEKWHRWLQKEYDHITALNQHWMRSYTSFDEVEWPVAGIYSDLGTRYRFDQERVADWMNWRIDLARQHDPTHKVVAHTGGIGPVAALNDPFGGDLTDTWLLTENLDVWGTSCYLPDFYQWSLLLDSTRSSALGHPYWVFELNGGRGHYKHPGEPGPGFYSNYLRSAEEVRSQVLLTFSHGGEGTVFWQWRPEHFGPESPGWGLTSAAGDLTDRTEALRGINSMLRAHKPLLDNLEFPQPQVGIIWEPKSYQAERLAGWKPGFGYLGGFELLGYHKALASLGLSVEYLNARLIVERGIPDHIKVLLHPYPVADRTGLAAQVNRWVADGGIFVAGPGVGLFDDRLNGSSRIPPDEWRAVLGTRYYETFYPAEPIIHTLMGTPRQLPGYHVIETYHLEGADPLGTWGTHVTMAAKKLGRGKAISVGTFLGQPSAFNHSSVLASWVSTLCAEANILPSLYATGANIFSRAAASGDTLLVFVHNVGSEPAAAWLNAANPSMSAEVINLLSGAQVGTLSQHRPLSVTLAAKDSALYAIHPT